jgi:hypothetical protein
MVHACFPLLTRPHCYSLLGGLKLATGIILLLACNNRTRAASPPVTDNFNMSSLNTSLWRFLNPVSNVSFSMTGTQLELNAPGGSNSVDFPVAAKFDSIPSPQYQFEGFVVDQNSASCLPFQIGFGSSVDVDASEVLSGNQTGLFADSITPPGGTTSVWLRVQRSGDTWTEAWSRNGTTFNTAGSFTLALTTTDIGLFTGNYGSPAPAFSALVESFVGGTAAAAPDMTITKSHTGTSRRANRSHLHDYGNELRHGSHQRNGDRDG